MCRTTIYAFSSCDCYDVLYVVCLAHIKRTALQIDDALCPDLVNEVEFVGEGGCGRYDNCYTGPDGPMRGISFCKNKQQREWEFECEGTTWNQVYERRALMQKEVRERARKGYKAGSESKSIWQAERHQREVMGDDKSVREHRCDELSEVLWRLQFSRDDEQMQPRDSKRLKRESDHVVEDDVKTSGEANSQDEVSITENEEDEALSFLI